VGGGRKRFERGKLATTEVFSGGTVSGNAACWTVPTADVQSLVMFAEPSSSNTQAFFALH
jgi:hypothetical protein